MAVPNRLSDVEPFRSRAAEAARPKVSLVNDDSAVLGSLKFLFKAAGFDVRGFADGHSLLASSAARLADCFVLDHRPRGADGLQLARRLRGLGLRAPILLTTGFRCGALETFASAVELTIAAPRVDEELIARLVRMIDDMRLGAGLRTVP